MLVASTATVRRARDQVEQVFARGLTVFPPPVLDAGETFFSATVPPSPSTPGRRYRGILAPGERLKSVEIRVASALMEHAQFLFDRHGAAADPYMTLVDYFTAPGSWPGCGAWSRTTSPTGCAASRSAPGGGRRSCRS